MFREESEYIKRGGTSSLESLVVESQEQLESLRHFYRGGVISTWRDRLENEEFDYISQERLFIPSVHFWGMNIDNCYSNIEKPLLGDSKFNTVHRVKYMLNEENWDKYPLFNKALDDNDGFEFGGYINKFNGVLLVRHLDMLSDQERVVYYKKVLRENKIVVSRSVLGELFMFFSLFDKPRPIRGTI